MYRVTSFTLIGGLMSNFKRFLCLLLMLVAIFAFSACDPEEDPSSSSEPPSSTEDPSSSEEPTSDDSSSSDDPVESGLREVENGNDELGSGYTVPIPPDYTKQ